MDSERNTFSYEETEDNLGLIEKEVDNFMDKVVPTPAMTRAFNQMEALTHSPEIDLLAKKFSVVDIRQRELLDENMLRELPTVYVGSGIDIHYPLLLGSRDIIMVDPSLSKPEFQAALLDAITQVTDGEWPEPVENDGWKFNFNFGQGNEQVRVTPIPAYYGVKQEDLPAGALAFTPPPEIAMLISFRSQVAGMPEFHIDSDPKALTAIKLGGYVLSYPMAPSFTEANRVTSRGSDDQGAAERLVELIAAGWGERGYADIPLKVRANFLLKKAF